MTAPDLTRHDGGGDMVGARLPANADDRPAAAAMLIERAIGRWALASFRTDAMAAAEMMLADQDDVEPLDMCLRLSPTVLSVCVGTHMVPIVLSSATTRRASVATAV